MSEDLDLPDANCWVLPAAGLRPGDVCRPVPLPKLEQGVELAVDQGPPRTYWVEAQMSFALVLAVHDIYAILTPIATPDVAQDEQQFATFAEAGRQAKRYVRLPELTGSWSPHAVALLYCPHTRLVSELEPLRAASMDDGAQERLTRRVAGAFEA
jgi:hypothetical protein